MEESHEECKEECYSNPISREEAAYQHYPDIETEATNANVVETTPRDRSITYFILQIIKLYLVSRSPSRQNQNPNKF